MPVLFFAGFMSWCSWALMIAVGVLHGAGMVDHTLGYDQSSALVWLAVPPVLVIVAAAKSVAPRDQG
jgi:uncharacterized membrane protein